MQLSVEVGISSTGEAVEPLCKNEAQSGDVLNAIVNQMQCSTLDTRGSEPVREAKQIQAALIRVADCGVDEPSGKHRGGRPDGRGDGEYELIGFVVAHGQMISVVARRTCSAETTGHFS